jgi:hypothetical protein
MKTLFLIIAAALVLVTSGCVRETGDVVINFTDLNISEQGINLSGPEGPSEEPGAMEEPETPEEPEANVTGEPDPCEGVVCEDSITTCPDGEVIACENECDPGTGECTACVPDCTGHEAPEECELECGACKALDEEACECVTILSCDGNGICEGGEWPDGQDCQAFGGCDDGDGCTLDIFDFNRQSCSHVDICCDDGDECTEDYYNYTTDSCEHPYICCGNGICEPGNGETEENCPEDCPEDAGEEAEEESGEEPGDVSIIHIDPEGETVTLEGYAIDMSGWTIEDAKFHVYFFPEGFVIDGTAYLNTFGNETDDNETWLFWGRSGPVWNNDGDNATLRNETGGIVSTYGYL